MVQVLNAAAIHTTGQIQGQIPEWRLSIEEDIDNVIKNDDGSYKKDVSLVNFGGASQQGARVEIYNRDEYTGKCVSVLRHQTPTEGIVFGYRDDEEFRFFYNSEEKIANFEQLGSIDVTLDLEGFSGIVKTIYVLPLSDTTAETALDLFHDDGNLGQTVIGVGTAGMNLVEIPVGIKNPHILKVRRNAVTQDKTKCVIFCLLERTKPESSEIAIGANEKVETVHTDDLGHFSHVFKFGQFVRVKHFFVKIEEDVAVDVTLEVRSVNDVLIAGNQKVIAQNTAAGTLLSGWFGNYITKSAKFCVNAGVDSVTAATIGVVYETLGNVVSYNINSPNGNVATLWTSPDKFDSEIVGLGLYATSVTAWVVGNFRVSVLKNAEAVANNVDCGKKQNFLPKNELARRQFVPADGLKVTTIATGESTEPVSIDIRLVLE